MSSRFRDLGISGAVDCEVFADEAGGYGVRFSHAGRTYFLSPKQDDMVQDPDDAVSFGTREEADAAAKQLSSEAGE